MSRVDHWRIQKLCNSNRMKSGTLGNERRNVRKIMDGYFHKSKYSRSPLSTNNKRKMLGKPMLRRVNLVRAHSQYYKKILKDSEVKNHEN